MRIKVAVNEALATGKAADKGGIAVLGWGVLGGAAGASSAGLFGLLCGTPFKSSEEINEPFLKPRPLANPLIARWRFLERTASRRDPWFNNPSWLCLTGSHA